MEREGTGEGKTKSLSWTSFFPWDDIVIEKHELNIFISLYYHLNLLQATLEHIHSSQAMHFLIFLLILADKGWLITQPHGLIYFQANEFGV